MKREEMETTISYDMTGIATVYTNMPRTVTKLKKLVEKGMAQLVETYTNQGEVTGYKFTLDARLISIRGVRSELCSKNPLV